jgi:hypothetical protein
MTTASATRRLSWGLLCLLTACGGEDLVTRDDAGASNEPAPDDDAGGGGARTTRDEAGEGGAGADTCLHVDANRNVTGGPVPSGETVTSPTGPAQTETRPGTGIREVTAYSLPVTIHSSADEGAETRIRAQADLLPHVRTEVVGDTLAVELAPGWYCSIQDAVITVELGPLTQVTASGVAAVELEVDTDAIALTSEGASSMTARGSVDSLRIDAGGTSTLNASGLRAQRASVTVSGVANASVCVLDSVEQSDIAPVSRFVNTCDGDG